MGKCFRFAIFLIAATFLFGCNESREANNKKEASGALSFYLKDAPSDELQSVFINIDSIQIFYSKDDEDKRYSIKNKDGRLVDLMKLRDGLALKLDELKFSPGVEISELRLILNPDNNYAVRLDGSRCDLKTPSAQKSGIKVKLSEDVELEDDFDYKLALDFDVDKSVVINPRKCILKPVLKIESLVRSKVEDDEDDDDDDSDDDRNDDEDDDNDNDDGDDDDSSSLDDGANFDSSDVSSIENINNFVGDQIIANDGAVDSGNEVVPVDSEPSASTEGGTSSEPVAEQPVSDQPVSSPISDQPLGLL